jgi:hypothetical protein
MSTLQVEGWFEPKRTYLLSSAVTGFEVFPDHLNSDRLGPVCELPIGAELEICGDGFNERTVRTRCGDGYYFVFWRDLALAVPPERLPGVWQSEYCCD